MKYDLDELFECRLLVLLENDEDRDEKGFRQVILTPEQFKKVSDIISEISDYQPDDLRENYQIAEVELGERVVKPEVFDGMTSFKKDNSI